MTDFEQLRHVVEGLQRAVDAQEKRPQSHGHYWIFVTMLGLLVLLGLAHLYSLVSINGRIEQISIQLEPIEIIEP